MHSSRIDRVQQGDLNPHILSAAYLLHLQFSFVCFFWWVTRFTYSATYTRFFSLVFSVWRSGEAALSDPGCVGWRGPDTVPRSFRSYLQVLMCDMVCNRSRQGCYCVARSVRVYLSPPLPSRICSSGRPQGRSDPADRFSSRTGAEQQTNTSSNS